MLAEEIPMNNTLVVLNYLVACMVVLKCSIICIFYFLYKYID